MRRISAVIFAIAATFALDTLTLGQTLDLAEEGNLQIQSAKKERSSRNLAETARERALMPQVTLGMSMPTYSYEESDVYIYVDSDPVASWKEKYGGSAYMRILMPTFWGGRMAIVPFFSGMAERYKLYNPRDIITNELLFHIRQPIIPESGEHRRLDKARIETNLEEIEYVIQRTNILLQAGLVFINLYVSQNKAERARILSVMAASFVEETEAKVGNDDVRQEWIWTATSRSLGARADSISAEQDLRLRYHQMANLLNLPSDTAFFVDDPAIPALAMTEDELVNMYIAQNPNILKLAAQLAQEEFELEELRMRHRAKVAVTGSYALQGQGETFPEAIETFGGNRWDFGVSVSLPVLDFGYASHEIASKEEMVEAKKRELEAEQRKQEAEIRILIDKLNTLAARFEVLKDAAIRAEKAINIVEQKYRSDEAELSQLYDSYNHFKGSMDRAISGKGDYYETLLRIKILCNIPLEVSRI